MAVQLSTKDEGFMILSPHDLITLVEAEIPAAELAMRPIDQAYVEELTQTDPAEWDPILVTLCSAGYLVIDGNHRWRATEKMGLLQIKATCKAFANENDIIDAAFVANFKHGKRASMQTRGDHAFWQSQLYPDRTQAEISRRSGITQGAVSKAIASRLALLAKANKEKKSDPDMQKKKVKKACRAYRQAGLRFLQEVEGVEDTDLILALQEAAKENQAEIERLGNLLSSLNKNKQIRPVRLRQFAQP